ncbi:MAG: DUF5666 domain-containing protein [Steroidobacteraceae bacterium]
METMNRTRTCSAGIAGIAGGLAVLAACILPIVAAAAAPSSPPVNGTVLSVTRGSLQLRTTDMAQASVALTPQTRFMKTVPAKLSELHGGDFIGTTAATRDGKLVATEVHVFAEALRGTGEGHYPWTQPNTTMTNGSVATMTNGAVSTMTSGNAAPRTDSAGNTLLTVTYKGGQQTVMVPATTPVTRIDVASASDLAAGTRVTVFGQVKADGSITADMLSIAPGR